MSMCPNQIWQLWQYVDYDYDDGGPDELVATYYSQQRARDRWRELTTKPYATFLAQHRKALADALRRVRGLTPRQQAFLDLTEAVQAAPTKELRIWANATLGQMRREERQRIEAAIAAGRNPIDQLFIADPRARAEDAQKQVLLTHDEYLEAVGGGYYLEPHWIADAGEVA